MSDSPLVIETREQLIAGLGELFPSGRVNLTVAETVDLIIEAVRQTVEQMEKEVSGPLAQPTALTNGHKPFEDSEVDAALVVIDWWVRPRKTAMADLLDGTHSLNDDMLALRDLIVRMSAAQPTPEKNT